MSLLEIYHKEIIVVAHKNLKAKTVIPSWIITMKKKLDTAKHPLTEEWLKKLRTSKRCNVMQPCQQLSCGLERVKANVVKYKHLAEFKQRLCGGSLPTFL